MPAAAQPRHADETRANPPPAATSAADEPTANTAEPTATGLRRSGAMDFDARVIQGEAAGKGMIVLFDRGQRMLPELTQPRRHFLQATVQEVLRDRAPGSVPDADSAQ